MKLLKDGYKLFPDQLEVAKGLSTKRHALYVDSTGSGKTFVVLYTFSYLYSKGLVDGLIIAAPRNAHDKEVWKSEVAKFTNFKALSFETVEANNSKGWPLTTCLKGVQVVYIKHTSFKNNYALVAGLVSHFQKPLVVVDEVHAVRTGNAQWSNLASLALKYAFAIWGITATDLSRDAMDLYNIVNFIYPGRLGSKWDYINKYCVVKEKVIGRLPNGMLKKAKQVTGFKNQEALRDFMSDFLVVGTRTVPVKLHEVSYDLSLKEQALYSKIANGIMLEGALEGEDWIKSILSRDDLVNSTVRSIKEVERHSSRYIYLQSVVDGSLSADGSFGLDSSSKSQELLNLCKQIASRGESALIYFDYYTSLDNIAYQLKVSGIQNPKGRPIRIIETSARKLQKAGFITKAMCDLNSWFVLCSRATSESENYPFINNVILYNIPTTPITYLQFIGRITRRNTLYPDDLHVWYLISNNIDMYKLQVIGNKMALMQATTYDLSSSFPQEYLQGFDDAAHLDKIKKHLLWKTR